MSEPSSDIDPGILRALDGLPAEFAHFPKVYQDEIRPALLAREGEREAAVSKARQSRYVGIGIAAVGVVVGVFLLKLVIVAIVSAVVGIGYLTWGGSDLRRFSKEAKSLILFLCI